MYRSKIRTENRYFIVFCLFLALFIFNFSTVFAADTSDSETSDVISISNPSNISVDSQLKEFDDIYPTLVSGIDLKSATVEIKGDLLNVVDLSVDGIVVKLPNDVMALRYSDNTTILPHNCEVNYIDNNYFVSSSDLDSVLKVSDVVVLPVNNFSDTAEFKQSIDNLDEYKVKIEFNELENKDLKDNIQGYTIDWGDGDIQNYTVEDQKATHIYKKSGTYDIALKIDDDFGYQHSVKKEYKVKYEGDLLHGYLWVKENKEPVAVTTSSSISLLTIGFIALTETGKYKFLALLPLLIPMYTRIQKEDVLDQFVRGQIFGYIKTNPGVHYNQIRRGIDVKNGTLSYHLSVLEKTELIKSRREGLRYRAFYPTGMKFPKKERFRLTEFQIEIIDIIKESDGISQKEIAVKLGKKPQMINYNIKVLEQADLIEVVKSGRKTNCYIKEETAPMDNTAQ